MALAERFVRGLPRNLACTVAHRQGTAETADHQRLFGLVGPARTPSLRRLIAATFGGLDRLGVVFFELQRVLHALDARAVVA
jgi:hypothetical protein